MLPLQFSVALRVLRGQKVLTLPFCRYRSAVTVLPLQFLKLQLTFFAALRGKGCCRCRSPRPSVSSVDKRF